MLELSKRYNICKSSVARKHLKEAKQALQLEYAKVDEERINLEIAEAESAFEANNTAQAWKTVNSLTGRRESPTGKLKGKTPQARVESGLNHFRKLLGSSVDPNSPKPTIDIVLDNINIDESNFTLEEVAAARAQVREGKAPGEDGITPETIKRVGIDKIILKYANGLLAGETPQQFSTFNIIPVSKKGNLAQPGNYRGIAITSLVEK